MKATMALDIMAIKSMKEAMWDSQNLCLEGQNNTLPTPKLCFFIVLTIKILHDIKVGFTT